MLKRNPNLIGILGMTLLAALIPLLGVGRYPISVLTIAANNALVALGMVLLVGWAGQISFGHAAFYTLGAYTSGILTARGLVPTPVGVVLGAAMAGLVAALIGRPILKMQHHFLALATLGVASIVFILVSQLTGLTGGPNGLLGIPHLAVGPWELGSSTANYYVAWIVLAFGMVVANNLIHSRTGRALAAIRSSEPAAQASGVDVATAKLKVFVLSAVFGGISGALYAHTITFISPTIATPAMSIQFMIMAVIGGTLSIWGAPLGALLITALTEILRGVVPKLLPDAGGEYEVIAYGLVLIVVLIYRPQGLATLFQGLSQRSRRTAQATTGEGS